MPDAGMAVPVAVGPLPYNYKLNEAGGFDKFGYSHTATAKEWRDPTEKIATEYTSGPSPPKGNKSDMVDELLSRWAPKRQRRQQDD